MAEVAPYAPGRRREGAAAHQDGDLHDAAQRGRRARHLALPHRQGERRCDGRGCGVRLLRAERHQQPRGRGCRGAGGRGLEGRRSRSRPHHLPPPHRQHRLQGRQRARLLRALGRRLRADAAARRRQPDGRRPDRAPGAHDAGPSEDRHPAEPGGRHAVVERVRAHLPVRHAPRHALLHHGAGLVGRRLRSVLGPQRAGAHQAVPRGLPPADPARQAAARRPRAVATTRWRPP